MVGAKQLELPAVVLLRDRWMGVGCFLECDSPSGLEAGL